MPVGDVDWQYVQWKLLCRQGLRPWEIRRMTLPEICVCLESDEEWEPRPPSGGSGEMAMRIRDPAYREKVLAMSASELLRFLRDGD